MAAADLGMMIHLMAVMSEGRTGMVRGIYSESENVGGVLASSSLGVVYEVSGGDASLLTVSAACFLTVLISVVMLGKGKGDEGSAVG